MAHEKFPVEILSPDGEIWTGEVEMISTRTGVGSIGLLANHTPMLTMLDPCELRLYESEGDPIRFAQGEGYLQVGGNRALMLVEEAHAPEDLDVSELKDKLSSCEKAVGDAEDGSEAQRVAQRDKRRWETFIAVAEGNYQAPSN